MKPLAVAWFLLLAAVGPGHTSPIISPSVVEVHRIGCMQQYNTCVKKNSAFGEAGWPQVAECQEQVIGCIIASDLTASQRYETDLRTGRMTPHLHMVEDDEGYTQEVPGDDIEDQNFNSHQESAGEVINQDQSGDMASDPGSGTREESSQEETQAEQPSEGEQNPSSGSESSDQQPGNQEEQQQQDEARPVSEEAEAPWPLDEQPVSDSEAAPEAVVNQHDASGGSQQVLAAAKPEDYVYHSNARLRARNNRHQRLDHSKQAAEVRKLAQVLDELRAGIA